MHTLWAKIGWVSIFLKKQIPNWRKWPQFESCQMYIFKICSTSTIHQTTAFNLKFIFVHSHAHPLSKYWPSQHNFKKQIPNWRKWPQFESCQCIFSKSTPHQQYTRQQPSTSNAYLSNPMHTLWAKIGWVSIFLKKQIPNWRKWPQFESCQMYIFKICSTSTIHQTTAFNLKFIFVHSHAHPLSKYWPSQHNFKKQIPNWRKWPQFESCQCIFSKSTPHQQYTRQQPSTSNAYLSTPMHTLWAKIGWVSIFLKNWFQIDANDLNLRGAKCIFSKSTPHQKYTRLQPSTSNTYLSTSMHTLWAKIGWVSIFLTNRFQIDPNYLNLRGAKCIFSKSTPHQQYTRQQPSTSNAYLSNPMHTLWAKIGWVSIFLKKQIPNWRKWPQFESCQMYIFKICSTSTIHQTTAFNLKFIFVHSHAHPLSKYWPSQHNFKKQIPNWRKWPQFESCQCIFSKSTPHQQYTRQQPSTSNAYLSNPMHTLWAKIGWVSIFLKKQIPNWRKWPQFESCQMYIFKICSTSTIHQTTAFNLKFIFVHSHAHPLSKYWPSQHNFKKQIPNWRKWPQFESCQCIFSKSTPHQQYTRQQPSTSNAYLSTPMHTLWAKIGWVSIFLKNRFQIDANDLNLRVAKCIFSKSAPHQQYTRQQPSTSNSYLSTPMHTLWANIGRVSIILKNKFQIDANDLNLRVANVYFQNLLLIKNTPDYNLQPQIHICPLPCTPFEPKLAESAYF